MEGIDGLTLGAVAGVLLMLIGILGFETISRIQDLEEESLEDKYLINNLNEEISYLKERLLVVRDKLEIDF